MTFAAVGSFFNSTSTSFTLTPGGVGDLILLEVENSGTALATGVSSSNVTWSQMGTSLTGSVNARTCVLFAGTVTSTSAQTVTVTMGAGTQGTIHAVGQEFSSTAGSWALDVQGNLDSAGTNTWPSLTPAGSGELYFGYSIDSGSAAAGSTTGYTYNANADGAGNGGAFNPSCGASATSPVWGDSGQIFGIMVLVKETGAAAGPADIPSVQPGPTWLARFKPQWPKPHPPMAEPAGPAGFIPNLSDQQFLPGPTWLEMFKPGRPRPRPPAPPANLGSVGGTASFSLAPLAFSASGGQTSPDVPQAAPGPTWLDLFKPSWPKPRQVTPPFPLGSVNGTAGFSLAPLAFSAQGAQTAPDQPSAQPGPTWLDLFKPGLPRPRPFIPAAPPAGVTATGSFALAPLAFQGQAGQTAPDIPSAQPGPLWLRLFRPWVPRPLPPAPAVQGVNATGSFTVAPLAFSANAGQSSPDVPQAVPGPFWLRLFKPWAQKPVPPPPAIPAVGATASFALAPLTFSAQGAQTSPDQPQVAPGPFWLTLFKRALPKPPPYVQGQQTGIQASASFSLAPLAFSGQAGETSPDQPQVQPGPTWLDLFRPWLPKPRPYIPSAPPAGVTASGSFALAPLAFQASAGQTSPDVPQAQPGPWWLRLFRPWAQRPVPVPPALQAVNAAGSLTLAPLALSGTGTVTGNPVADLPQIAPGPTWQRLYRPWQPRPAPFLPSGAAQAAAHQILVTAGDPFTLWETGSPVTGWQAGDPFTAWETGSLIISE